jgi:predicted histone-like DNA-binding protein
MAILYTTVERYNPQKPEEDKRFYPQVQVNGEMTLRELGTRIAKISTVSTIDTMAVIEALLQVIPEELMQSRIIRLGDFGSFFTTLSGTGTDSEKEFDGSKIRKASIRFRPGMEVKGMLKNAQYRKVKKQEKAA